MGVEFACDRKDRFGEWFDGEAVVDFLGVGLGGTSSKEGDDTAFVDGVGGGGVGDESGELAFMT